MNNSYRVFVFWSVTYEVIEICTAFIVLSFSFCLLLNLVNVLSTSLIALLLLDSHHSSIHPSSLQDAMAAWHTEHARAAALSRELDAVNRGIVCDSDSDLICRLVHSHQTHAQLIHIHFQTVLSVSFHFKIPMPPILI